MSTISATRHRGNRMACKAVDSPELYPPQPDPVMSCVLLRSITNCGGNRWQHWPWGVSTKYAVSPQQSITRDDLEENSGLHVEAYCRSRKVTAASKVWSLRNQRHSSVSGNSAPCLINSNINDVISLSIRPDDNKIEL